LKAIFEKIKSGGGFWRFIHTETVDVSRRNHGDVCLQTGKIRGIVNDKKLPIFVIKLTEKNEPCGVMASGPIPNGDIKKGFIIKME
jgi:hypothetical protein